MDDIDDEPIEIRCISAAVRFDGAIDVELVVSGYDEPIRQTFDGTDDTVLLNWSQEPKPIDLDGTSAAERRCQEIVSRAIARLRVDLERQRSMRRRRRQVARERAEAAGCMHPAAVRGLPVVAEVG